MLNVAVLISGRGSNLRALVEAAQQPGYPAKIVGVLSNKADAAGLAIAQAAGIPVAILQHRDFASREDFDRAMDVKLKEFGAQLVCLAGFMRLVSGWFVEEWRDRLVNIHPSLLPAFPGLHPHRDALTYGVKFSGCTVHFVRAEMDHGPIVLQAVVPILPEDTEDSLAARVLVAEHRAYPQAVRWIAEGRVNVHEERAFVAGTRGDSSFCFNPVAG